jgi:selenocysteine lyase/cysteine desulfurase
MYSDQEFPSIAHVWLAQRARGARPESIRNVGRHADMAAQYAERIDRNTKFVSIPHTGYLDGRTLPVKRIAACARSVGAKVFVDAYQAVGVQAVDVGELDCDYLVGGAMKYLLGMPGLAFLFVRDGLGNDIDPQLTGWFGRKRPFDFDATTLDFPDGASRFETGTPSIPSIYAANAGLGLVGGLEPHSVQEHVASLVDYASEKLLSQGDRLLHVPRRGEHGAHLALADASPALLADFLLKHGIAVSPRGNALRLSFHYYNDAADIDLFCEFLKRYRKTSTPPI